MTAARAKTPGKSPSRGGGRWTERWADRPRRDPGFDELRPGGPWADLFAATGLDDSAHLAAVALESERLIREIGISYTIYEDAGAGSRPWSFDPLPLVLTAQEWRGVEAAVAQRARLLNAILGDLYGPMTLFHDGLLPPSLALANPGFLRPLHGAKPAKGIWLHLLAVDLVRLPDGRWRALSDRTQAPSGMGYALANREVSSRLFGDALAAAGVRPLNPFFERLRDSFSALSPVEDPTLVVLTPGPFNETFFEHAYQARGLGCRLVRGDDLTVRDGHVYLDTIAGPEPVHIILRRLDDAFADPLTLRTDSALGVAGLVGAIRAGNVVVVNAIGSGAIETPALLPFLPQAAQALLGEELLMPAVETSWLAPDGASLPWADAVLKPGSAAGVALPRFVRKLDAALKKSLGQDLARNPWGWVAQRRIDPSTLPALSGGKVEARPIVLRCFAATDGAGGWTVMPGGLTRYAVDPTLPIVSMQRGGGSKDSWILDAEAAARPPSIETTLDAQVSTRRPVGALPSRVADNQYWLGRYVERTEHLTRLLRAFALRAVDSAVAPATEPLMIAALNRIGLTPSVAPDRSQRGLAHPLILTAMTSRQPAALPALIEQVIRIAGQLRDRLAPDAWRVLSRLAALPSTLDPETAGPGAAIARLDGLLIDLAAWSGIVAENQTRGVAWRFLDAGRRIERLIQTAGLIDVAVNNESRQASLSFLLEATDSALTYRWRARAGLHLGPILDAIVGDETNPRALAFQAASIAGHIPTLPGIEAGQAGALIRRLSEELHYGLRLADSEAWSAPLVLTQEITKVIDRAARLSEALSLRYFRHAVD